MKTILYIEDDRVLRENIAELLVLFKYAVVTAPNGRIGVEKAKNLNPDIIISDVLMPELDGYEVFHELSLNESTRNIPFIFLSAKTEPRDMLKGIDMGANAYIKKPFEEHELIDTIEAAISNIKEV